MCTTTKYDDAAVGTRLTPSKNHRRCLPCFLRASQFPTTLLLVVSSCWYLSRCRSLRRHPILGAVTPGYRGISSPSLPPPSPVYPSGYTGCPVIGGARSVHQGQFAGRQAGNFFPPTWPRKNGRHCWTYRMLPNDRPNRNRGEFNPGRILIFVPWIPGQPGFGFGSASVRLVRSARARLVAEWSSRGRMLSVR
jgi:hypothetical protein